MKTYLFTILLIYLITPVSSQEKKLYVGTYATGIDMKKNFEKWNPYADSFGTIHGIIEIDTTKGLDHHIETVEKDFKHRDKTGPSIILGILDKMKRDFDIFISGFKAGTYHTFLIGISDFSHNSNEESLFTDKESQTFARNGATNRLEGFFIKETKGRGWTNLPVFVQGVNKEQNLSFAKRLSSTDEKIYTLDDLHGQIKEMILKSFEEVPVVIILYLLDTSGSLRETAPTVAEKVTRLSTDIPKRPRETHKEIVMEPGTIYVGSNSSTAQAHAIYHRVTFTKRLHIIPPITKRDYDLFLNATGRSGTNPAPYLQPDDMQTMVSYWDSVEYLHYFSKLNNNIWQGKKGRFIIPTEEMLERSFQMNLLDINDKFYLSDTYFSEYDLAEEACIDPAGPPTGIHKTIKGYSPDYRGVMSPHDKSPIIGLCLMFVEDIPLAPQDDSHI